MSVILLILFVSSGSAQGDNKETLFKPGQVWLDTNGQAINAHGGGIL